MKIAFVYPTLGDILFSEKDTTIETLAADIQLVYDGLKASGYTDSDLKAVTFFFGEGNVLPFSKVVLNHLQSLDTGDQMPH